MVSVGVLLVSGGCLKCLECFRYLEYDMKALYDCKLTVYD